MNCVTVSKNKFALGMSNMTVQNEPYKSKIRHFYRISYIYKGYLLLVVRQHLIGSQVLTRCPPLFVVHGIQAVVEYRSSR